MLVSPPPQRVGKQIHNRYCPSKNIASTHCHDVGSQLRRWQGDAPVKLPKVYLKGSSRTFPLPSTLSVQFGSMGMLEKTNFVDIQMGWHARGSAVVLGTTFTAGEPLVGVRKKGWSTRRCSSLFTAVIGGRSRYGLIRKFIERADGSGSKFAVVKWLPIPSYPYGNPLIVCIRDGDRIGDLHSLLDIECIDPCNVGVERSDIESCYYVYRFEGLDTVRI